MEDNFVRKGKVTYVVDGDTFDAVVDLGYGVQVERRFRMLGIDTAEMRDKDPVLKAKAVQGKQYTQKALFGNTVYILTDKFEKDAFGRYLCTVFINGRNINAELLDNGLAEVYKR